MISLAQMIVLAFGILMIVLTTVQYYRKKIKLLDFLIWFGVWAFFVVAILLFKQIRYIGEIVFKLEIMDFFLLFAVLIIFGLIYVMYNNTKKTQEQLNKLIEYLALQEGKKAIKKNKKK